VSGWRIIIMRAQKIHVASLVFFILAFVFYFVANNVAIALGILGVVSELIAWFIWLSNGSSNSSTK
jgi:hypothetical protein